ncbi:Peptidase S10, serine carboxypeptidase [Artemisia annua]|uniref:Peptidase S10, serine carboxypeptidase n=1 Tax=Artemisia annua TaxID=35608 RepID=A0A2U1MKJ0_ARTAN|nr:Peptidase S10, serine carboxypeptidase [Artemisia annua]
MALPDISGSQRNNEYECVLLKGRLKKLLLIMECSHIRTLELKLRHISQSCNCNATLTQVTATEGWRYVGEAFCPPKSQSQKELHKKHHNITDGRLRYGLIRQIMKSIDRLLLETRDTAKELQTGNHMLDRCLSLQTVHYVAELHGEKCKFSHNTIPLTKFKLREFTHINNDLLLGSAVDGSGYGYVIPGVIGHTISVSKTPVVNIVIGNTDANAYTVLLLFYLFTQPRTRHSRYMKIAGLHVSGYEASMLAVVRLPFANPLIVVIVTDLMRTPVNDNTLHKNDMASLSPTRVSFQDIEKLARKEVNEAIANKGSVHQSYQDFNNDTCYFRNNSKNVGHAPSCGNHLEYTTDCNLIQGSVTQTICAGVPNMGENALKEQTSGTVTMTIIGLASNNVVHEILECPVCLDRMCLPIQRDLNLSPFVGMIMATSVPLGQRHIIFCKICLGPLKILNGNYIDDVPALQLDPTSWTKLANIIYLDGPTLTGYSYTTTSEAARSSDTLSASQTTEFIRKFVRDHPRFLKNPIIIVGSKSEPKVWILEKLCECMIQSLLDKTAKWVDIGIPPAHFDPFGVDESGPQNISPRSIIVGSKSEPKVWILEKLCECMIQSLLDKTAKWVDIGIPPAHFDPFGVDESGPQNISPRRFLTGGADCFKMMKWVAEMMQVSSSSLEVSVVINNHLHHHNQSSTKGPHFLSQTGGDPQTVDQIMKIVEEAKVPPPVSHSHNGYGWGNYDEDDNDDKEDGESRY